VGAPKEAAAPADYRERLTALRDRLEARVAEASDRELAPLSARYVDVLDKLAALPEVKAEGDRVDDLAARRARSAAPSRSKRPAAG
jgi:hypothetical protein